MDDNTTIALTINGKERTLTVHQRQVWLWNRRLRRVHRPAEQSARTCLPDAGHPG
jgi:hypothetical protein